MGRLRLSGLQLQVNFLISQPKHMLWVLKRTVSMSEMVLLNTQNICLKVWVRKYLRFYAEIFCLSKPVDYACSNIFFQFDKALIYFY